MPRKPAKRGPGGARAGSGRKPVAGAARSVNRTVKLTPEEAAAQDAAAEREAQPWPEWIRGAADLALARGSTR